MINVLLFLCLASLYVFFTFWNSPVSRKKVHIIGAPSGWGAQIRECEEGPEVLNESGLKDKLKYSGVLVHGWDSVIPFKSFKLGNIPLEKALPIITDHNLRLAGQVSEVVNQGNFPLVIGGDHTIAIGTWNGVRWPLKNKSSLPFGLIWVDAHMDCHVTETSPSGAWHGMPLAGLLGYGHESLSRLKRKEPVLLPENLCLVGIRSFEEEEAELVKRLNVKVFYMDEVEERGILAVLGDAVAHVSKNTVGFGVSLDLDVIDPKDAPGVGSPEPGGVRADELIQALKILSNNTDLKGFEIVEYNPNRDVDGKTKKIVQDCAEAIFRLET